MVKEEEEAKEASHEWEDYSFAFNLNTVIGWIIKKSILERASEKKVMAKYETVVADKKLRESGFPLDPTMRKKSRGECKKQGKM